MDGYSPIVMIGFDPSPNHFGCSEKMHHPKSTSSSADRVAGAAETDAVNAIIVRHRNALLVGMPRNQPQERPENA